VSQDSNTSQEKHSFPVIPQLPSGEEELHFIEQTHDLQEVSPQDDHVGSWPT
jgi:hypothetical protein